jgi:hypothetical protein
MALIKQFGLHRPRNQENLDELEDLAGHKSGIYVLCHGAMPVYIGRGQSVRGCAAMARKDTGKNNSGTGFRGS